MITSAVPQPVAIQNERIYNISIGEMEMNILFGYDHFSSIEKRTYQKSIKQFPWAAKDIPNLIDLLCKLRYFFGNPPPIELESSLHWFCAKHFIHAPYTLKAINDLFFTGYYLETLILARHLLEAFVRMKYFKKFPEKLEPHLNNKMRITYKTMFNEFSPEIYESWYGDQLSDAAHGVYFKEILQTDRSDNNNLKVINGPEFDIIASDYALVWIFSLFLAFLKSFFLCFPQNTLSNDLDLKDRHIKSIEVLKTYIDSHKKIQQNSMKFYEPFEKLIF